MTSKRRARQRAYEEAITCGELKQMVTNTRGRGGQSCVNPQFSLEDVLDMFDGALQGRADDDVPRDSHRRSDIMLTINVLRECT